MEERERPLQLIPNQSNYSELTAHILEALYEAEAALSVAQLIDRLELTDSRALRGVMGQTLGRLKSAGYVTKLFRGYYQLNKASCLIQETL